MLAELRYLRSVLLVFAVLAAVVPVMILVAFPLHAGLEFAIVVVVLLLLAAASVWALIFLLQLRSGRAVHRGGYPAPPARYAPMLLTASMTYLFGYAAYCSYASMVAGNDPAARNTLVTSGVSFVFAAWRLTREILRIFRGGAQPARRRPSGIRQFERAQALPTYAQRERAMGMLRRRGAIRLAFLAGAFASMAALIPQFGFRIAAAVAFVAFAAILFALERFVFRERI